MSVARVLRDYKEAGSLNELIALWGLIDGSAFLTKSGHVGLVYQFRGVDYEGLTHEQRRMLVQRGSWPPLLDEHCRVYQYLVKRTIDPIMPLACRQPVAREAIQ